MPGRKSRWPTRRLWSWPARPSSPRPSAKAGVWCRGTVGKVSVQQALKHPNWKMGKKITIDSATMMNKGLEVVEARWEFDMEPARIEVVIHPQSVVHSLGRYQDGSIIAQLG